MVGRFEVTVLENPFIPIIPTERQSLVLTLDDEFDVGYGGAAGGGKSELLLIAAAQGVEIPGYAALIVRKTFKELAKSDALMDRAFSWFRPTKAAWNGTKARWTFPSGARIEFGHLEHKGAEHDYDGSAYQTICVDQVEEFGTETQPRYLMSRLRKPVGMEFPLRYRTSFNPMGSGHQWVSTKYIPSDYKSLRDRSVWTKNGASFVFANLEDNPHLDHESYIAALDRLDPVTRNALLLGDWRSAIPGEYFKREWFEIIDIRPRFKKRVRYWDLAGSESEEAAYTAGVRSGISITGEYVVDHVVRGKWTTGTRDEVILNTAKMDGVETKVVVEQEPGSGGKAQVDYIKAKLRGFRVHARPKRVKKEVEWGPLASWSESRKCYLVSGDWNRDFIDELVGLPHSNFKDQVDAASGGFQVLGFAKPRVRIRRVR